MLFEVVSVKYIRAKHPEMAAKTAAAQKAEQTYQGEKLMAEKQAAAQKAAELAVAHAVAAEKALAEVEKAGALLARGERTVSCMD